MSTILKKHNIFIILDRNKRNQTIDILSKHSQKIYEGNKKLISIDTNYCLMYDPTAEDWFIGVGQHDQVEITLNQLDELLQNGELVVNNPTFGLIKESKEKYYKLLRPCLWFCKGDTVTSSEFNKYFKEAAIEQLIQYGFIELIQKP